jgi:26S proteasome regulatory subunit N7
MFLIEMAPFYEQVCVDLKLKKDETLVSSLKTANQQQLLKLEEKLKDAEQNLGETDISDALIAKAQYLAKIGDKVGVSFDTTLIQP